MGNQPLPEEYAGRKLAEPTHCHLFEFAPKRYRTFGLDAKAVARLLNKPTYTLEGVIVADINDEPDDWLGTLIKGGLTVALYEGVK